MKLAAGRILGIKAVRAYQLAVSPWLPPACRFVPTCSEYALQAIEQYGIVRGTIRAVARLLRCHPLHRGGFDPLT
jgi:putative membrane protein insertion efficiency factor